jgi:hypothetical protein
MDYFQKYGFTSNYGIQSNSNTNTAVAVSSSNSNDDSSESPIISDNSNDTNEFNFENVNAQIQNCNLELVNLKLKHIKSGYNSVNQNNLMVKSQIELLHIMKQAQAPLYLFENVWKWAQKSAQSYNINFASVESINRAACIANLQNCFDLNGLKPVKQTVTLQGTGHQVEVIKHSFIHSFYTLLNDTDLMNEENLLISKDLLFETNIKARSKIPVLNDIDTGSVYQTASNLMTDITKKEILCPIIFFVDKTHTDVHGRLCIEQIRFTLGIFNRNTRNKPAAWRTLGYIADQSALPAKSSQIKSQDYHHMISIILKEFKDAQRESFQWQLHFNDSEFVDVHFIIPVLFLIGDTEGHDKMAGRYLSRNRIKRLCRYCDISYDDSDNPDFEYTYSNHDLLEYTTDNTTKEDLKNMSIHGVTNAWKEIIFCDPVRGLFGALCADILHCIQHGLFEYALQALFDRKEIKTDHQYDSDATIDEFEYSKKNLFSKEYSIHFDGLTKRYGKFLLHQSDRDLGRTHINTNYLSVANKNAHEMSGIIIVFLVIFTSSEGTNKLDLLMADKGAANFIHLFENLLLLENFCLSDEHKNQDVTKFRKFLPYLLHNYKTTLDRQTGCGCKFIKFHLPCHFANDIQRFGSMLNFDTGIGESHHKSEAKLPAKNTQRRKSEFDYQTAIRQIENLSIDLGMTLLQNNDDNLQSCGYVNDNSQIDSKLYRYYYDPDFGLCQNCGENTKKFRLCNWMDQKFQKQLMQICKRLYETNAIVGKLKFFTQHNRHDIIFRADPNYQDDVCWYDWAEVNWSDEIIPTKLLLYWDIKPNQIQKKFKIGSITIKDPGQYAFAYSLRSAKKLVPAHRTSRLVQYGTLDTTKNGDPSLYILHVDTIASVISAVPYQIKEDIHIATEWIFIRPKAEWYSIFTKFMAETLINEKQKSKEKEPNTTKRLKTN